MNCIEMDLIQGRFQLKASVLNILLHSVNSLKLPVKVEKHEYVHIVGSKTFRIKSKGTYFCT